MPQQAVAAVQPCWLLLLSLLMRLLPAARRGLGSRAHACKQD